MFEGDSGVFFGPLTGDDVSRMPDALLPDRLAWGTDRYAEVGPYADLRLESAAATREDPAPDRLAFGRELLLLEPLLDGALRIDGPTPAAMGVVPWDRAVPDVPDAGVAPEKKARRMARRLFPEDDDDDLYPRRPSAPDPDALRRAADLVEAISRLRTLELQTEERSRRARLHAVRADLLRRLGRERRHDLALDGLIGPDAPLDTHTVARLRHALTAANASVPTDAGSTDAPPVRVRPEPSTAQGNPYLAAIADAEVRLAGPLAQDIVADPDRLAAVQRAVAEAVARVGRGGDAAERARVRAARLFAEEVALTGGRPGLRPAVGIDTLALRRTLASATPVFDVPVASGGLVPAAGLPEIPLLAHRTPGARVTGSVPAGARIAVDGPPRGGFYAVRVAGQRRWIPEAFLARPDTPERGSRPWPQPMEPPANLPPLPTAARPLGGARLEGTRGGPIDVRHVVLDAPPGGDADARRLLSTALAALPDVLTSRMRGRPARNVERDTLELVLDVPAGPPSVRGRILADQLADALVKAGAASLDTLNVRLRMREVKAAPTSETLLESIAADDTESVAAALVSERRTLDAATRSRLAGFFGHDFDDVMVFAGPMSGAMARSLSAEAFTHGKMVFFDPKHFRPDTPRGEALLAHELTHTRQAESRADVKAKEAQALAAEARFLDWVSPGGAPLAQELEEAADVTTRDAQAAADATPGRLGVHRAETGRQLEASEGPRADTAQFEERVKTVLDRVRLLVGERGDFEADRLGRMLRAGVVRF
jgi:hypothetical protein